MKYPKSERYTKTIGKDASISNILAAARVGKVVGSHDPRIAGALHSQVFIAAVIDIAVNLAGTTIAQLESLDCKPTSCESANGQLSTHVRSICECKPTNGRLASNDGGSCW